MTNLPHNDIFPSAVLRSYNRSAVEMADSMCSREAGEVGWQIREESLEHAPLSLPPCGGAGVGWHGPGGVHGGETRLCPRPSYFSPPHFSSCLGLLVGVVHPSLIRGVYSDGGCHRSMWTSKLGTPSFCLCEAWMPHRTCMT